jgi:phosphonate transport system permease protein
LAAVMLLLELVLARLRQRWQGPNRELLLALAVLLVLLLPASSWLELRWQVLFSPWQWPEVLPLWDPSGWLQDWPQLIGSTLLLTAMAALLAVALLPLLLLLLGAGPLPRFFLSACGLLARLLPPPLTALLLLFVLQPGLLPAVLALGFHNAGILGRLGLEGLDALPPGPSQALRLAGSSPRQVLLMAGFNGIGRSYLSFGAYRADVILRESVVVGLVGAGGLGVVLLESLSSFAWGEVLPVLVVYAGLTLVGEQLADLYRRRLLSGPLPEEGVAPAASS